MRVQAIIIVVANAVKDSATILIAIEERLLLNQVGNKALPDSHGVVILKSETIEKLST